MKTTDVLSNKHVLETRYTTSRTNLLLVVAFTAINILLVLTKSDSYFLFSAYVPYVLVTAGMFVCGRYPAEYYGDEYAAMEFFDTPVFVVLLVLALVLLSFYFVSWIFSKNKKSGWLMFALVIFSLDTLVMFLFEGFALDSIIDIAFHVWVIVSLCLGINAGHKLKKMPLEEMDVLEPEFTESDAENTDSFVQ